jgi:hypothetical protein
MVTLVPEAQAAGAGADAAPAARPITLDTRFAVRVVDGAGKPLPLATIKSITVWRGPVQPGGRPVPPVGDLRRQPMQWRFGGPPPIVGRVGDGWVLVDKQQFALAQRGYAMEIEAETDGGKSLRASATHDGTSRVEFKVGGDAVPAVPPAGGAAPPGPAAAAVRTDIVKDRSVLLVSSDNFYLSKAVEAVTAGKATVIGVDEFTPEFAAKFDVVIFDNTRAGTSLDAGRFIVFGGVPSDLVLNPGRGHDRTFEFLKDVRVTGWKKDHPLLKGLDLGGLVVSSAVKVAVPDGAEVLIEGRENPRIPLAVLRVEPKRTLLVLPFNLTDSNWPLKRSFPVFLEQAINFLADRRPAADAASAPAVTAPVKSPITSPDGSSPTAKREELTRLFDERIKISRNLSEARNKLANLKSLAETNGDPPGLDEALAQDDEYSGCVRAAAESQAQLEDTRLGSQHPRVLSARAKFAALRKRADALRAQKRNDVFASQAARFQADIDADEKLLKDVKEQIGRAETEYASSDAGRRELELAKARAEERTPATLSAEDIARIDAVMLDRVRERDRIRRELDKLLLVMVPTNPAVVSLERQLKAEQQRIDDYTEEFRAKWQVNGNFVAAAPATRQARGAPVDLEVQPDGRGPASAPAAPGGGVYYLGGRIPRPGAYSLGTRPVNLLQALISAGLDVDSERDRQVVLLRREGTGEGDRPPREVSTSISVGQLVDHREKDVFLWADDIVLLKAAPQPPAWNAAPVIESPPGLWQRLAEHLSAAGYKELEKVTVFSAYADPEAGEAYVALRVPRQGGEQEAMMHRLHRKGATWEVEGPSYGPRGAAGIGLTQFQKEYPSARRFAEPLSVAPLKNPANQE